MSGPLERLRQRRERLVAASASQRAALVARLEPLARRLGAADRAVNAVRAHPVMAGVALSALALLGPRALLGWAARLVPVYSLLRRL